MTVPAFAVNVDPAPDVFHVPVTVQLPLVVIVPDEPPAMATPPVPTVTDEFPAWSTPALVTTRPLEAPPPNPRPVVARVAPCVPSPMVRIPPHRNAFADIVKVDALVGRNDTLFENSYVPLVPKVIVGDDVEENVIAAANDQEAEAEVFVQAPDTDQDPPVEVTYAVALPMDTLPATETADPLVFRIPATPLTVRPPAAVMA